MLTSHLFESNLKKKRPYWTPLNGKVLSCFQNQKLVIEVVFHFCPVFVFLDVCFPLTFLLIIMTS